ncbi:Autoinducer 2 sensor kinase/phosphatase LuxQ [Caulifigura coniformis]|uniref:histidine kinase n=1 Tax=Caulifigura coniformis TaxID=2527983 RepID=A0A517SDF8_9PLAN|nr:ATP-binding protein [Caulifigura coniformis]QDT54163.1 Autoinducer 2 sensor kinase/phosphatase LuxQ [Caulifigura coniformis]
MTASSHALDHRVLLLTPTRRDAETSKALLADHGIESEICRNINVLCEEAARGAGALLVTQEAIFSSTDQCLTKLVQGQPSWSDYPLIVLTPAGPQSAADIAALAAVGHMLLLQRPLQIGMLISTVQAALRDRARQYLVRDHLAEQEAYAAALRESDRRKDEFLAVLAHELRNPLAPLRTGIDLLLLENQARDDDLIPMMSRQTSHMVRLIDDLLDLSRISQGKLTLRTSTVSLGEVIGNAVEATRQQIESAGHQLHVAVSGPLHVTGDPVRLTQVFANLLSNAAKYTEQGGQIHLASERVQEKAVVRVRDTGLGIPPEMLSRVFEMFAQVDSSLGRAGGGLGIGLTLVRQLVEMHQGSIRVASDGLGCGSEFTVELPTVAGMPRSGAVRGPEFGSRGPSMNVVVADDNVDAAETLAMLLRQLGHHVRIVHDGQQAVEVVCRNRPELAIIDIGMPVLTGYDAATRIREQLGSRNGVYLAALTGWGQEEDRRRALDAGFDAHMVKPVETSRLASLIEAARRGVSS